LNGSTPFSSGDRNRAAGLGATLLGRRRALGWMFCTLGVIFAAGGLVFPVVHRYFYH
jgi:hypothetical protein